MTNKVVKTPKNIKKTTNNVTSNSNHEAIVKAIVDLASNTFTGTMTQLVSELSKMNIDVPQSPISFRFTLNKIVNKIRNKRVSVSFKKMPGGTRIVTFQKTNNKK